MYEVAILALMDRFKAKFSLETNFREWTSSSICFYSTPIDLLKRSEVHIEQVDWYAGITYLAGGPFSKVSF